MNQEPLISVIIPTYNRAHLISRAINSVLNQTYSNFEIIVVNDGSTDNTKKTIESFNDRRIISYNHEKNKGVLATKNAGFNLAKGEYISILDDDDELMPNALETVIKYIERYPSIKILLFAIIDSESGLLSSNAPKEEIVVSYDDYLSGKYDGDTWTVLHRDALKNYRFDERLYANESILLLKLFQKFKARNIPIVLYKAYRLHGERLSTEKLYKNMQNLKKITLTKRVYLEEFGEDLQRLNPKRYGTKMAELGCSQILNDERKDGMLNIRKAFKYNFYSKYLVFYFFGFVLNTEQIRKLYILYSEFYEIQISLLTLFSKK